ncbi:MAG: hypothetical protein AAF637_24845, partial [Pseudomonadota bacterium]
VDNGPATRSVMPEQKSDNRTRYVRPLPQNPDLEKHRKLAKALVRDMVRGDPEARARVETLHPKPPARDALTLADAQLVIARGYGFASWAKLKHKIESLTQTPKDQFVEAVVAGDVERVRTLLAGYSKLVAQINEPWFEFGRSAALAAAGDLPMLDLLLAHGADINARSVWDPGGFGILDGATQGQAEGLLQRGARMDVWAAAHLGRLDDLRELIIADPSLVHAKGGDGKRPLHFASTVPIAAFLLEQGAEIDAKDDDHDSIPAQHLIGDHPEVTRFLVAQGAVTDVLMACALGDVHLVRKHLDADPAAIRMRVSQAWLPMIDTAKNGGHMYQWTLGFYLSTFQIARKFEHPEVLALLRRRAEPRDLFLDALWTGDFSAADRLLSDHPGLVGSLDDEALNQVADAARQNATATVEAMLARGFPVTAVSQHRATPLHFAAFHGNPAMTRFILERGPDIEVKDRDFESPPLGWAIHGSMHGWPGIATDEYGATVRLLLEAGASCPEAALPTGNEEVDRELRAHLLAS